MILVDYIKSLLIFIGNILPFTIKHIVWGGGTALNCPANSMLASRFPHLDFFIDPSCNDEGLSVGASFALLQKFAKVNAGPP